jgi:glucokinase
MDSYVAVDIGGTQIRVAVFPVESATPLVNTRTPTQGEGSAVERLIGAIASVLPLAGNVRAIAMAAPGPIDPQRGIIFSAPNIPGWENLPLRDLIQERFGIRTLLGNDANLAALGEWRFGAAKGHHDVLFLTVSTGIGGGVIINDRMLLGDSGLAGELGHVTVIPDGPLCGCGLRGHLEAVASGTGIARYVQEQLASGRASSMSELCHPNSRQVAQAAEDGDPLAVEAMTRAATFLGVAVADFLHIFNPSVVILGGGVSRSGHLFLDPLREALFSHVLSPAYVQDLQISYAALGDDVGLMGALALAHTTE